MLTFGILRDVVPTAPPAGRTIRIVQLQRVRQEADEGCFPGEQDGGGSEEGSGADAEGPEGAAAAEGGLRCPSRYPHLCVSRTDKQAHAYKCCDTAATVLSSYSQDVPRLRDAWSPCTLKHTKIRPTSEPFQDYAHPADKLTLIATNCSKPVLRAGSAGGRGWYIGMFGPLQLAR